MANVDNSRHYEYVALLGVDGMGAFCKYANAKNINEIFKNGATTYDCRAVYPSISAQCWGSMLLGVAPEVHGLTNQMIIENEYDGEFPTVFKLISKEFPESHSASFCCWNPINHGIVENLPGVTKEKVGDFNIPQRVRDYFEEKGVPKFLFIHFNSIDASGHKNTYGTEPFLRDIEKIDECIGEIWKTYSDAGIIDKTLFMVTADHGGIRTAHGGNSPEEMNVFFGAAGKTVKNSSLPKMCIQDIPAIICSAFGIEKDTSWNSNVPENLFE